MSKHCYLDRRYFEVVLRNLAPDCVLTHPFYLNLIETETGVSNYSIQAEYSTMSPGQMSAGCVVLRSQFLLHSTAIFLDPKAKKVWWWNPYLNKTKTTPLKCGCRSEHSKSLADRFTRVNNIAHELLKNYFALYGFTEFEQLEDSVDEICVKTCSQSGFCNAYVLKYAYDWLLNKEFDGKNILHFANYIEDKYEHLLPPGEPEVEFGPGGALIGGLGGVFIGGALGGAGGALLGGLGGAALGGGFYDKEANTESRGDGALAGGLGGAALGGMSGGVGGALAGGLIGGAIGSSLSDKNEHHRGNPLAGALVGGLVGGAVAGAGGAVLGGVAGATLAGHDRNLENDAYTIRGETIVTHSQAESNEHDRAEGAVVGGLGGAALGGLVAGPIGLVAGGLTGAVVGGAVANDNHSYMRYSKEGSNQRVAKPRNIRNYSRYEASEEK